MNLTLEVKELMNVILKKGIELNASDIHIYPKLSGEAIIKFRVLGNLIENKEFNNNEVESIISLLKFNANIDISLNKTPQSGRFEYILNEKKYYLRVSTLPLNEIFEGCVVRIFTDEIDDVQYSIFEDDIKKIKSLIKLANGIIIFSGPTGSGKSTSMYKLAIDIAKENKQVISIEDPVEKNIDSIVQMQVNKKAGINYDNALKSILRCDPDVIMVGEIRDSLTAQYLITSAYSGHLVLTTIHAEDSIGVINRLKDLGVCIEDLKQTLVCIISQRLVKTVNGRELITEILDKNSINNYINNLNTDYKPLKEKFEDIFNRGLITNDEKEKWGY